MNANFLLETLSSNSAPAGGGIFNDGDSSGSRATLVLLNSTLAGNSAGGIDNS